MWQPANREAARASPLLLPVLPHVGETDTDTLKEIHGRTTEAEEENKEEVVEEEEFGYSWSEFTLCISKRWNYNYILLGRFTVAVFEDQPTCSYADIKANITLEFSISIREVQFSDETAGGSSDYPHIMFDWQVEYCVAFIDLFG